MRIKVTYDALAVHCSRKTYANLWLPDLIYSENSQRNAAKRMPILTMETILNLHP